ASAIWKSRRHLYYKNGNLIAIFATPSSPDRGGGGRQGWRLRPRQGRVHEGARHRVVSPRSGKASRILDDMTIQRMDNVGIVVDDLEAAVAFFVALGMELEGEMPVAGRWVDRIVGLDGVRADIAMMRTPDGHSKLELTKFHTPAAISADPRVASANVL